jgi:hypothetical protein
MRMWFLWAGVIFGVGLIGLGIFELIVGYAFGRHGTHSRSDAPVEYWTTMGVHFVVGIALIIPSIKAYRDDRTLSDRER